MRTHTFGHQSSSGRQAEAPLERRLRLDCCHSVRAPSILSNLRREVQARSRAVAEDCVRRQPEWLLWSNHVSFAHQPDTGRQHPARPRVCDQRSRGLPRTSGAYNHPSLAIAFTLPNDWRTKST